MFLKKKKLKKTVKIVLVKSFWEKIYLFKKLFFEKKFFQKFLKFFKKEKNFSPLVHKSPYASSAAHKRLAHKRPWLKVTVREFSKLFKKKIISLYYVITELTSFELSLIHSSKNN